jgi:DTW domain-containing protein YfiP
MKNKTNVLRPSKPKQRPNEEYTARPFCFDCYRPQKVCICSITKQINNQIEIGIIRHPKESKNTFNTAILAHLSLKNSFLEDTLTADNSTLLHKKISDYKPEEIGLLFPSKNSESLETTNNNLKCLIAVDGTWSEAKKIAKNSSLLNSINHYHFTPIKTSNYLLRKEPQDNYVCTIEAIAYSLEIIEKSDVSKNHLLDVFNKAQKFYKLLEKKDNRHQRNKEYWSIKKRIKQINTQVYSQNIKDIDVSRLLLELEELKAKIKS